MSSAIRPHFVHRLVAGLVILGGAFDVIDGLRIQHHFHSHPLTEWLPLEVHHGSRALLVLSGILLIALGRGLGRGKRRAWQLAVIVVSISLVLHLVRNIHLIYVVPSVALLIYLIFARRSFIAGSDPASTRQSLTLGPVLLLAILVYGVLGQYRLRQVIDPPFSVTQALRSTVRAAVLVEPGVKPQTRHAAEFLDSVVWLALGSALVLVWLLLRPVILRHLDPSFPSAVDIIQQHGEYALATFAADPENHHLVTSDGTSAVAFRISTGVAITLGDPIGPPENRKTAVDEFLAHCRKHDWVPCFYEVGESNLNSYRALGLRTLKIAEEAVISLADFDLGAPKLKKLRNSITKVERENPGIHVELIHSPFPAEIADQLQLISEQWLASKGSTEMGFTMGRFDPVILARQKLFAALLERRVLGFVTWRMFAGGGHALDLMRYATDAPYGLMDCLIARSLQRFQKDGHEVASLSNAPLANVSPEDEFTVLDHGVKLLFENVHGIYEYKSLFQFKKKFNPDWKGRYLVFPSLDLMPRIAVAILRAHRQRSLERQLLDAA